eukprot:746841-Hanusia_phi.AAC.4
MNKLALYDQALRQLISTGEHRTPGTAFQALLTPYSNGLDFTTYTLSSFRGCQPLSSSCITHTPFRPGMASRQSN